ncbi:retrovirus-related pol polyprotein from transposon TNT 1-94 [Tanacetum coccineum]
MLTKPQVFYADTHKQALGYQNPFYLKEAQRIKPTLYDGIVISKKHNVISVGDSEETLILEEKSRSKMLTKQNDPILKEKKVVKVIITPTAITEGGWGFEHTKKVFLEEVIPFINSLRESFKDFNNGLHNELNEVKTVFNQMEVAVEQCSIFINEYNENLVLKAELAKKEYMVEKKVFNVVEIFKINEWQAKLNAKDVLIANLRKHVESLKGKNVVEKDVQPNNANVIAPGMFRLDLEPLAPRVLKNKDAHIDYIKHTQENADILWEIEVLVYVTDTCPSLTKSSEKLVAITSLNKNKKVRWSKSSSGTVIFGNDQIANNMVYGDYQMGNVMISWVYYVEGLGYKLFSVGEVYDLNLEVAFHKHTCYIRDLEGDLLDRARITDKMVEDIPIDAKANFTPTDGDPLPDPSLYRTLVASLVYLTVTHLDISYAVHIVSQFVSAPTTVHWAVVL